MSAPPIVTRAQWGAARPIPGGRHVAPSARRNWVTHYPVMSNRPNNQWMRDIERIHVNQGWFGIGYNYCVAQDGSILEGCGRDIRGIHAGTRNTDSWGVCGLLPTTPQGVATQPLSQAMRNSMRQLYEWLCTVAGRRLTMSYHSAHMATSCPGPELRNWTRAGMPATTTTPPPPQPEPEDEQMIDMMTAGGQTLVFAVSQDRRFVGVTWQGPNSLAWNGQGRGGAGWPAGMVPFAAAPQGHLITGLTAQVAATGTPHVIIRTNRAETFATWQERSGWVGAGGGYHAAFRHFAARP